MSKQGRRHFLGGSAAAAVTAMTGCGPQATPQAMAAAPACGSVYGPDPNLANAIVMAWTDPVFKAKLLTFPEANLTPSWTPTPMNSHTMMVNHTFAAFQQAHISQVNVRNPGATVPVTTSLAQYPPAGGAKSPVVLTDAQFNAHTFSPGMNELLFVLPDPVTTPTSANAVKAMCVRPFGM